MIRLVINADDLGMHPAIDEGILRAHREGVVSSATVLVSGRHAPAAIERARAQGLPLGLHLCLSTRLAPVLPAAQVVSLAPDGRFRSSWAEVAGALFSGSLRLGEVEAEFRAQLARARELGADPDHLDAHQHLHLLPGVRGVVCRLSREHRLAVRWPRELPRAKSLSQAAKSGMLSALGQLPLSRPWRALPARGVSHSGELGEAALLSLLDQLPDGDHEIVCHPGEEPGTVPEDPHWCYRWSAELNALLSRKVRQRLVERNIRLSSYRELFHP